MQLVLNKPFYDYKYKKPKIYLFKFKKLVNSKSPYSCFKTNVKNIKAKSIQKTTTNIPVTNLILNNLKISFKLSTLYI